MNYSLILSIGEGLLHCFYLSGILAIQLITKGIKSKVAEFIEWLTEYIQNNLQHWIVEHGGWGGLVKFHTDGQEKYTMANFWGNM